MIERISQHILDILEADARLIAGGNAYAAGWTGTSREENDETPAAGLVNLFDKSHDPDGDGHRPAIYVGTRGLEASDALDFPTCSQGGRTEFRVMLIPLILCVQATTKRGARQQRNQLRHNVKAILLDNILADGHWYELTMPGQAGSGPASERVWTTATGGQQVAEGVATVPVQVRYSWSTTSDA